jgi:hypothetical protein
MVTRLAASARDSCTMNCPAKIAAVIRGPIAVSGIPVAVPGVIRPALRCGLGQFLEGVQGRLPFRHRTLGKCGSALGVMPRAPPVRCRSGR